MQYNNVELPTETPEYVNSTIDTFGVLSGLYDSLRINSVQTLGSATWPTASLAIFIPVCVPNYFVVKNCFWYNGTVVSGNVDFGIYNLAGTRLASIGTTVQAGTSTIQSAALVLALNPGVYFLALSIDNITATVQRSLGPNNNLFLEASGIQQMAAAFVLPSTATYANPTNAYVPYIGIMQVSTI